MDHGFDPNWPDAFVFTADQLSPTPLESVSLLSDEVDGIQFELRWTWDPAFTFDGVGGLSLYNPLGVTAAITSSVGSLSLLAYQNGEPTVLQSAPVPTSAYNPSIAIGCGAGSCGGRFLLVSSPYFSGVSIHNPDIPYIPETLSLGGSFGGVQVSGMLSAQGTAPEPSSALLVLLGIGAAVRRRMRLGSGR